MRWFDDNLKTTFPFLDRRRVERSKCERGQRMRRRCGSPWSTRSPRRAFASQGDPTWRSPRHPPLKLPYDILTYFCLLSGSGTCHSLFTISIFSFLLRCVRDVSPQFHLHHLRLYKVAFVLLLFHLWCLQQDVHSCESALLTMSSILSFHSSIANPRQGSFSIGSLSIQGGGMICDSFSYFFDNFHTWWYIGGCRANAKIDYTIFVIASYFCVFS